MTKRLGFARGCFRPWGLGLGPSLLLAGGRLLQLLVWACLNFHVLSVTCLWLTASRWHFHLHHAISSDIASEQAPVFPVFPSPRMSVLDNPGEVSGVD